MADFFDFLHSVSPYEGNHTAIKRLNQRRKLIIEPFLEQIEEARVLDIACHDGRWSYALAAAGASEVIGVEARQPLIDRFKEFPNTEYKSKIELVQGDLFDVLESLNSCNESFDLVALYGIFYHVMDHFRLLSMIQSLGPKLIILDSEFISLENAMIQVLKEEVSNPLNATSKIAGSSYTVVGVPSLKATEFMADALGYELVWIDHKLLLDDDHEGMHDYFRTGRKVRRTCALVKN